MKNLRTRIERLEIALKPLQSSLPPEARMQAFFPEEGELKCANTDALIEERLIKLRAKYGDFDESEVGWAFVQYEDNEIAPTE